MGFAGAYGIWTEGRLSQDEAALMLGVCTRKLWRYIDRYEERGWEGLSDAQLTQASCHRAPTDEVLALAKQCESHHRVWNLKYFYGCYQRDGRQSYTGVKNLLQSRGLASTTAKLGTHRRRRERAPPSGMMLHRTEVTMNGYRERSGTLL